MRNVLTFSMLLSICFVLLVLYFIRKRHLKEQYSLLWLGFGLIIILMSINADWLEAVAAWVDVKYPPSLLFLCGILFCLILIFYLTVVVSKLAERTIRLTQEIGILQNQIENNMHMLSKCVAKATLEEEKKE